MMVSTGGAPPKDDMICSFFRLVKSDNAAT